VRALPRLLPLALGFAAGSALPAGGGWVAAAAISLPLALSPALAPLAFLGAGALAAGAISTSTPTPTPTDGERDLEGRVVSVPDHLEGRVRFLLRERSGALLQVTAAPPRWPLALGDQVRLRARSFAPEGPRNPGGRDAAFLLAARGVSALAHARGPPQRVAPPAALTWVEAGRSRFAAAATAALPPAEAALVRAIGAGDRSGIDPATTEAFARSGLAHLLSVSGLHLAVVALGAWRAARALLLRSDRLSACLDPRRAAALLALPVAGLYALATGADVPVVRSALAAGLGFAGALLDRETSALSSLALALLAALAFEPGAIHDISLQLSFASVAGLALLTRPLRALLPWQPPPGRAGRAADGLLLAVATGLAATVATAPLVAWHFRRISLLAPLANLAGVPIGSALTVTAAAATLLAAAWPPLALPLLWASWPLAWLLLRVNALFAAPDWAVAGLASPGPLGLAAAYAGILGACLLAGTRRRVLCAALALAGVAGPGLVREAAAARRGLLEVVFVSVGQGDATFLRLPDGAAVLVDAGGDPRGRMDPGARDLVPFLRDAGVRRLWAAVLTHPDPDHGLGFGAVGSAFPVERFATAGREAEGAMAAALARLPPAVALRRGEAWERAGVRLRVLSPPPGAEAWADNDASLVLRVEHGQVAFLLLADAEAEAEEAMLASGLPLAADVAKVGHHGSRSSSGAALVAAVRPRWAVFSVGRRNPFGHPAPEVVARWRAAGAEALRTDEEGGIRLLSDGERVWRANAGGAVDAWEMWGERRTSTPTSTPTAHEDTP